MSVKPRVRLITPVWGSQYIDRWLDLCIAALRSDDNLSFLNAHCDFELTLVTKSSDAERLSIDPKFNAIMSGIRVRFVSLDEFLPITGQTSYGVPLTLAYAKGIIDPGPSAVGSYVILMNADFVVAAGSMKVLVERIKEGFAIIAANSIRIVDGTARSQLYRYIDKQTGILSISPRDMWRLANMHLHTSVTSRIVNDAPPVDSIYYHQMYWRISEDCLAIRSFLLMPLCFRVDRIMEKVICPIDYGFLTEFCPDGRFCAIGDSDDFLMIELQERHSESHWLRPAPRFETPNAYLSRLSSEIASQAATWSTAEHRRSATKTIYYHSADLPPDLASRVAPFEAFVDTLLNRMPPPVSHIGHFQWLPAVRIYRDDMARTGSGQTIALLDDPQNSAPEGYAGAETDPWTTERFLGPSQKFRAWALRLAGLYAQRFAPVFLQRIVASPVYRHQLGRFVAERLPPGPGTVDVAFIGDIRGHAPMPPPGSRIVHCANRPGDNASGNFSIEIAPPDAANAPTDLVIYAGIGLLALWERLEDDIERLLRGRKKIVLVLLREGFQPLPFEGHTYMLSLLLTCLPRLKFRTTLDVYVAPDKSSLEFWRAALEYWSMAPSPYRKGNLAWRSPWQLMRQSIRQLLKQISTLMPVLKIRTCPKMGFSALVVAIEPRQKPTAH